MNKRKLVIITLVVLLAALVVWLLIRKDPKPPETLVASEIVATNIKHTDQLPQSSDSLTFFTGTAIADITFPKGGGAAISLTGLDDVPFEDVDKISSSDDLTLVRSYFDPGSSLLNFAPGARLTGRSGAGKSWFVINKSGQVSPLTLQNQDTIADGLVDGEQIYLLVNQSGGKQQLVSIKGTAEPKVVADGLAATSFVGALEGRIVMRDFRGKVYIHYGGATDEVASNVGEVWLDRTSGRLVLSPINESEVGEEGGIAASQTTEKPPTKVDIIRVDSREKQTLTLPYPIFFVSKGFVLSVPELSRPSRIELSNLVTEEQFGIAIDQSGNKVTGPVSSLHILKGDFSLIGAITTNNQLVLYGEGDFIKKQAPAKLPIVKSTIGLYGYEYNIRANQLTIFYDSAADTDIISASLVLFEDQCDCDINQLSKQWRETASEPGL